MKLLRYGPEGQEKPGRLDENGRIRDLSGVISDLEGDVLDPDFLKQLAGRSPADLPLVEGTPRIGPCVGRIGTFLCIGLNYADHAAESQNDPAPEPIIFSKAISAVCGPDDPIIIPRGSERTDWEVELAVVIGRKARYVSEAAALSHVAGYCIVNDVSEREYQLRRYGQWIKGKSGDHFGPIGPWLVTADEVGDPQTLDLRLELNGERMQESSTSKMIFSVRHLISYISQCMTLLPGDVISTGTPAGVGAGHKPPRFLRPGDHVRLMISGLGEQNQDVIASE